MDENSLHRDGLLLELLREGDACGSELIRRLELRNEDAFRGREGELYPALHRLEHRGLADAEERDTKRGFTRRFYSLSRKARRPDGQTGADRARADAARSAAAVPDRAAEPGRGGSEGKSAERREPGYDPRYDPNSPDFAAEALRMAMDDGKEHDPRRDPASPDFEWDPVREAIPGSLRGTPADYEGWVDRAVRGLSWPGTRRRAKKELSEHLADRIAVLQSSGLSFRQARAKALEQMGDPAKTARQLRKADKPLRSWCLAVCRLLIVLMLAGVTVALIRNEGAPFRRLDREQLLKTFQIIPDENDENDAGERKTVIAARPWSCTDEAELGPWKIRCEDFLFQYCRKDYVSEEDRNTRSYLNTYCDLLLRLSARPWSKLLMLSSELRVEDSTGREYRVVPRAQRAAPGEYVVLLNLSRSPSDRAEWLDVLIGKGEDAQRLRIYMESWAYDRDALPEMPQTSELLQTAEAEAKIFWIDCKWPQAVAVRHCDPASARTGETELQIPAAKQTAFHISSLERVLVERNRPDREWTASSVQEMMDVSYVECDLILRGPSDTLPVFEEELLGCLRVTDAAGGAEAGSIGCWLQTTPHWYADGCCLRLIWEAIPGAEGYELQYTPPTGGAPCSLRIALGEEVTP